MQVERITVSNRELRRKHRSLQGQVRNMCDERADFLVQMQDQQRNITGLRQRLGLAQKENEDLAKSDVSDLKCVKLRVKLCIGVERGPGSYKQGCIRFRRS